MDAAVQQELFQAGQGGENQRCVVPLKRLDQERNHLQNKWKKWNEISLQDQINQLLSGYQNFFKFNKYD